MDNKSKGGKKNRKYGRNAVKCAQYARTHAQKGPKFTKSKEKEDKLLAGASMRFIVHRFAKSVEHEISMATKIAAITAKNALRQQSAQAKAQKVSAAIMVYQTEMALINAQ